VSADASRPYSDDLDLDDDAILLRRIRPDWVRWEETGATGQWPRITSQACQDYSEAMAARLGCPAPAMSVGLLAVLEAAGKDSTELLIGYAGYGIATVTVAQVRGLGQGIALWPTDSEPWHALVFMRGGGIKALGTRSKLAEAAIWRIRPPQQG
jgi:hypothetical protein